MSQLVRLERSGPRAVVTLDSPANRNALSRAALEQLRTALATALTEPGVRVVVLTGTGPVFCSGLDLKEQAAAGGPGPVGLPEVLTLLLEAPRPVVARVNGAARAGGVGLLAACDLAVGYASATFGFSGVRLGIAPAVIAVPVLRRVERQAVRELFLTGEPFDGAAAAAMGLVTTAVPPGRLDDEVDRVVAALAAGHPQGLRESKRLLTAGVLAAIERDGAALADLSQRLFASAEARAAMDAFLTRR